MKTIYIHNGIGYVILEKKPIHSFCKSYQTAPNMQHVQMYMQWKNADHVLRTDSHFLFCETIQDVEYEELTQNKDD